MKSNQLPDFLFTGCTRRPCQNSGWCIQGPIQGQEYVCRCRIGFIGDPCPYSRFFTLLSAFKHDVPVSGENLRIVAGDPHILTFDQKNLHPQGTGVYTIARSTAAANLSSPFTVVSKFENRNGNTDVSYVKYVEINVYGYTIRLDRNNLVYVSIRVKSFLESAFK